MNPVYSVSHQCIWATIHKILVLIACAQMPPLNAHADFSSRARGLIFVIPVRLFLIPYFVFARSEGSGRST